MENRLIVITLFLISVFTSISADIRERDKSEQPIVQLLRSDINIDSIVFDCSIDVEYNPEGCGHSNILNVQLILNDSISLFKIKTKTQYLGKEYMPITLNKSSVNCLKILLYNLYSNNNSIIADKYIRSNTTYKSSDSYLWKIKINLDGKEIKESHNIAPYMVFDDSLNFPFYPIWQLILAITNKIERDILQLENIKPKAAQWITEMFHDEYYLPYNDINSNK